MKITGDKKHGDRLKHMTGSGLDAELARGLFAAGKEIEIEAEHSITEGSISGKGHIPSAPGSPPNADTRLLDTSIDTFVVSQSPPTVHVVSSAPYSAALEWGTSKMEARPFMQPATDKKRKMGIEIIARIMNRRNRKSV
jgi:HK97 gp10 family phage protein